MTISLHDIQLTLQRLWIDSEVCEDYFRRDASDYPADGGSATFRRRAHRQGIELYGRLLRYGWHDVMSSIYPLCEHLLGDEWQSTVDSYLKICPPSRFNLNRLAEHFSCYLASQEDGVLRKFPFIAQLADYEWMELEVLEHPGMVLRESYEPLSTMDQFGALGPIINPTLRIRQYQYPLLDIADVIERGECIGCTPKRAGVAFLVAFRPSRSSVCRIVGVSNLAFVVLEAALAKASTYGVLASHAINSCQDLSPQDAALAFIDLIEKLQDMDVLVGHRAA